MIPDNSSFPGSIDTPPKPPGFDQVVPKPVTPVDRSFGVAMEEDLVQTIDNGQKCEPMESEMIQSESADDIKVDAEADVVADIEIDSKVDVPPKELSPVRKETKPEPVISPTPVRRVLTIIPSQPKIDPEPKRKTPEPSNEVKGTPPKKKANKKPEEEVVEIKVEEVAPVMGRKTKQKKFKAPTIKKKVPRQVPVEVVEEKEPEPIQPSIEQEQIETMGGLDLNEFITKIDHMQLLARTLADLVQVLDTESNNSHEFIKRFEAVAQTMTPTQFVEGALDPLIATAHRLSESLVAQYEREKHLESRNVRGSPWTSAQWEDQVHALSIVIEDLQSSRDVLVQINDSFEVDELSESDESEPNMPPDVYLETILSTIHDLIFQALPRPVEKGKKRKLKAKRVIKADPLYCLAAATGLDPSEIARMTKPQQRAFVKAIQREYPDPVKLITTILESSEPIDFHKVYEKSAENTIDLLTREVEECIKEERELAEKFEIVKTRNDEWRTEVEEMLGIEYPSDDDWIDED